ncbi:MAG: hypothetical protein JNN31_10425 [Dechloromonas sp.]|nr:hypothetical protein [Dechloromonas sp.]
MAASNSTATHDGLFEYRELPWGDLIYGTKEFLQKIGLGVGMAFPGEIGGPRRRLNTVDQRGFKCKIEEASYMGERGFSASIPFPDRDRQFGCSDWEFFAPGVQRKAMYWTDDFKGTADDLVAAGLVPIGHFPGLPGMRKTRVVIFPDGSLPKGAPAANHNRDKGAGTKRIERISSTLFCVKIDIPEELGERRIEAFNRAEAEWESRMRSLPRPPRIDEPLRLARNQAANERRSALRLVWSKPRFVPEFNNLPPGPFAR